MAQKNNAKIRNRFPLIRQVLLDAFHVESLLLSYPYEDADKLDGGMRNLLWDGYSLSEEFASSFATLTEYSVTAFKSAIGFYNVFAVVSTGGKPDVISVGPFSTENVPAAEKARDISRNFSPRHLAAIEQFFLMLPVAPLTDVMSALTHLVTDAIPDFAGAPVYYYNYSASSHRLLVHEDAVSAYNEQGAERFTENVSRLLDAVAVGDVGEAMAHLNRLLPHYEVETPATLAAVQHTISYLNHFCAHRLLGTSVHPYYVVRQMEVFDSIAVRGTTDGFIRVACEVVSRYCAIARNLSHPDCSQLVRDAMSYIELHLDADVTLDVLSRHANKNASYLSAQFKREAGCTVTEYARRARVDAAMRRLGATDMPISDVAASVGYSDFGYFSRIFKKEAGMSPREYRKMLRGEERSK